MSVTPAIHMACFSHTGATSSTNTPNDPTIAPPKPSQPRFYSHTATTDSEKGTITPPTLALRKYVVDEILGDILSIPKHSQILEDEIWPYNVDTLNEIIRFKIEQEKTKQELMRHETTQTLLQLLQLAQSLHILPHLVPMMFVLDPEHAHHLKQQLQLYRTKPEEEVRRELHEKFHKIELGQLINPELTPTLPKLVAILPQTTLVSEPVAAKPLPPLRKRRTVLDSLDRVQLAMTLTMGLALARGLALGLASGLALGLVLAPSVSHIYGSTVVTPVATTGTGTNSSPVQPQQAQPAVYPLYYSDAANPSFGKLGLPYSQKYTPTVIMGQPPYIPMHYPYFVNLPPTNAPYVVLLPLVGAPPAPAPVAAHPPKQPVPSHKFQLEESNNVFRPAEIPDEHPNKRQKVKLAINFMITTPKNPPQQKYNKDRH